MKYSLLQSTAFITKSDGSVLPTTVTKEYIVQQKQTYGFIPFSFQLDSGSTLVSAELYKGDYTKTVTRHIWQEYLERAEDIRHSPVGKATYALRSQTIERVFADAKEKHAMRYTPYRGLAAVTAWVKLKFAAMNLKKLALHKWRPLSYFYFLLLQEATLLRCKVASLTGCVDGFPSTVFCIEKKATFRHPFSMAQRAETALLPKA